MFEWPQQYLTMWRNNQTVGQQHKYNANVREENRLYIALRGYLPLSNEQLKRQIAKNADCNPNHRECLHWTKQFHKFTPYFGDTFALACILHILPKTSTWTKNFGLVKTYYISKYLDYLNIMMNFMLSIYVQFHQQSAKFSWLKT